MKPDVIASAGKREQVMKHMQKINVLDIFLGDPSSVNLAWCVFCFFSVPIRGAPRRPLPFLEHILNVMVFGMFLPEAPAQS